MKKQAAGSGLLWPSKAATQHDEIIGRPAKFNRNLSPESCFPDDLRSRGGQGAEPGPLWGLGASYWSVLQAWHCLSLELFREEYVVDRNGSSNWNFVS